MQSQDILQYMNKIRDKIQIQMIQIQIQNWASNTGDEYQMWVGWETSVCPWDNFASAARIRVFNWRSGDLLSDTTTQDWKLDTRIPNTKNKYKPGYKSKYKYKQDIRKSTQNN